MTFFPSFEFEVTNAFWFSLLFVLSNVLILKIYPSHYQKRVLSIPRFKDWFQWVTGVLNFILFQSLIVLTVFLPVRAGNFYFIIGILLFLISYLLYLASVVNYATSNPERPVTKGIYKYSRNPQQLFTVIMWIGIGLITGCGMILFICVLQLYTMYPTFIAQEEHCIQKYGIEYEEYMKRVPRYFGL